MLVKVKSQPKLDIPSTINTDQILSVDPTMYLQNVQFYVCFTHENMKTKLSKVGYFSKIAEIFMYCPEGPIWPKTAKVQEFL